MPKAKPRKGGALSDHPPTWHHITQTLHTQSQATSLRITFTPSCTTLCYWSAFWPTILQQQAAKEKFSGTQCHRQRKYCSSITYDERQPFPTVTGHQSTMQLFTNHLFLVSKQLKVLYLFQVMFYASKTNNEW